MNERTSQFECDDGIDNDVPPDGQVDFPGDTDCLSPTDPSEDNISLCSDGIDNDLDGYVDYPQDPGCFDQTDNNERDAAVQCDDGIDNDGDFNADFPGDPDCVDPRDPYEAF